MTPRAQVGGCAGAHETKRAETTPPCQEKLRRDEHGSGANHTSVTVGFPAQHRRGQRYRPLPGWRTWITIG